MSVSNIASTPNWWSQQHEAMHGSQSSSAATGTANSSSATSASNTGTTASATNPTPFFVDFASDLQAMLARMSGASTGAGGNTSTTATTTTTTADTNTEDQTSSVNGTHHRRQHEGGDGSIQGDATRLVGEAAQTLQNTAGGAGNVATAASAFAGDVVQAMQAYGGTAALASATAAAVSRPHPNVIEAVAVVGDLLRPDGKGRPGGVDRPTLWLFNAIKRQLYLAAGLPVEPLTTAGLPELRACIEALRPVATADAYWASIHAGLPASHPLAPLVTERLRRRFCVGYELPPWLVRLLDDGLVPYLDLRLHPVRFMDDLMFASRASCLDTQVALFSVAVNETEVIATAGLREAMCRFISEAKVPDDTLLVVGQRPFDSSQIVDGGFFDAWPRASEIHAICAQHRAVILKPHPHDKEHSLLAVAAAAPAGVLGVIADNLYRIVALPQVSAVLTVNSSVAHEAPYFAKRLYTLAPLPIRLGWHGAAPEPDLYASLDDVVLTPDFWRIVLAPHAPASRPDGIRLRAKPNRLRIAFDSFWNFQEIDTDRIPRRKGS